MCDPGNHEPGCPRQFTMEHGILFAEIDAECFCDPDCIRAELDRRAKAFERMFIALARVAPLAALHRFRHQIEDSILRIVTDDFFDDHQGIYIDPPESSDNGHGLPF